MPVEFFAKASLKLKLVETKLNLTALTQTLTYHVTAGNFPNQDGSRQFEYNENGAHDDVLQADEWGEERGYVFVLLVEESLLTTSISVVLSRAAERQPRNPNTMMTAAMVRQM